MQQKYKSIAFLIPLAYLSLGLYYPIFGYAMALCMGTAMVLAASDGRKWCGSLCPRGLLYDKFLGFNRKKPVPAWLKSKHARNIFFAVFMSAFIWRLSLTGGDLYKIGSVFITMGIISGTIGLVLGILYKTRSWCVICPMGVMSSWVAALRGRAGAMTIAADCKECRICERKCPMQIPIVSYKESQVAPIADAACIRCGECASACPRGVIKRSGVDTSTNRPAQESV
ncbi:ferredoxin, putative [Heliomicrobium modesticaldum Ice1]|uniref:Ferredoxin, putative n=1 Tax=Heliobacterium modesticaldum (strain ATCC 51547 / Ice1) TaxID=498761 RepID=B0TFT3_HELMI|nr:4Fe-4S binding protein [Heliomicrobium modesticaldum]ABZ84513.1 ferredoxin, putative [Heliomicrobium modesticaldum Ice1]